MVQAPWPWSRTPLFGHGLSAWRKIRAVASAIPLQFASDSRRCATDCFCDLSVRVGLGVFYLDDRALEHSKTPAVTTGCHD